MSRQELYFEYKLAILSSIFSRSFLMLSRDLAENLFKRLSALIDVKFVYRFHEPLELLIRLLFWVFTFGHGRTLPDSPRL